MKLKVNIVNTELAPEGVHAATVKSIEDAGAGKCLLKFEFTADEKKHQVDKSYQAKIEPNSPLLRDIQVIARKTFTAEDSKAEFDLNNILDKPCRVVIQHKRTNGGRMKASVETVLEAEEVETKA